MKIIESTVNYTVPGFYWDGVTAWLVDGVGCGWSLGTNRDAVSCFENEAPTTDLSGKSTADVVATIDAVARLLSAGN